MSKNKLYLLTLITAFNVHKTCCENKLDVILLSPWDISYSNEIPKTL